MKKLLFLVALIMFWVSAFPQTNSKVQKSGDGSAIGMTTGLEALAVKPLIIPPVSGIEAVVSPEEGMMVFDTIRGQIWYYGIKGWVMLLGTHPGSGYLHVDEDGSLTLKGEATAWEDIRIAATSTLASNANPPVYEKILDNGKGSRGVMAWFFEDVVRESLQQEIFFEVQLPHQWRSGSGIRPHVHWLPTDNSSTGSVRWGLEYSWAGINEAFPRTEIIYATSRDVQRGESGTHLITPLPEIDGSGKGISSMLLCRLFRASNSPEDTYKGWAGFLEFDFHYEVSSLGSREEYVK